MKYRSTPYLRFKKFKEKWQLKVLGNLGSVAMNKRIFKEETSEVGEIPFYKIGTFGSEPDSFITREKFEEYKSKYPYPEIGDILISASGSIGRTVEYQGEEVYFQDSNIVWLKHDERLDNSFLKQFYSIVKWQGIEGTTIKRLYNKNILETPIALPSISEQSAIGSLFRTLDDLLVSYKDNLANYQSLKATMLSKMFPKAGQTVPEIRLDGFEGEWKKSKLKDVAHRVQGNDGRMDLPTLTISASGGWMNQIDRFSANIAGKEQKNYTLLKKGELSYNHGNSKLAKYGVVFELQDYEEALVPKVYHSFRVNQLADAKFIEIMFSTKIPDRELGKLVSSGARMDGLLNISFDDFMNIAIIIPTLEEQQAIGSYFSNLDNLIAAHQEKISQLETLKKKLLQDMFI